MIEFDKSAICYQKIYLAGKITGDNDYRDKFRSYFEYYTNYNNAVINPATLPAGLRIDDYVRICKAMIDSADIVVFLPDWRDSQGAKIEHDYCDLIGKDYIELGG